MPNYSHFDNTAPCGGQGLYVGATGSEVQVASSTGALYQSGTAITATAAKLNNVPTYSVGHVSAASKLVAYGNATLHSESATIATGLTTVAAAVATLRHDDLHDLSSTLDPSILAVEYTSGNLKIGALRLVGISATGARAFRIQDGASECSVDWIAFGT